MNDVALQANLLFDKIQLASRDAFEVMKASEVLDEDKFNLKFGDLKRSLLAIEEEFRKLSKFKE